MPKHVQKFCFERRSDRPAKQPWHGTDPGALVRPERGASDLCVVLHVSRPSARTIAIAERFMKTAPEPRYWALRLEADGATLSADVGWHDVEGEMLCRAT